MLFWYNFLSCYRSKVKEVVPQLRLLIFKNYLQIFKIFEFYLIISKNFSFSKYFDISKLISMKYTKIFDFSEDNNFKIFWLIILSIESFSNLKTCPKIFSFTDYPNIVFFPKWFTLCFGQIGGAGSGKFGTTPLAYSPRFM